MASQDIEIEYDFTAGHAVSTHTPLTAHDLSSLSTRDFFSHMARANEEHEAACRRHQEAQEALALMLTEQVTRHVLSLHPTASLLFVRAAAEFHQSPTGEPAPNCEGHNHRLVPYEVCDADGHTLGEFDPLSPVHYWMERLSPLLGVEDQILDIESRSWAYDCTAA